MVLQGSHAFLSHVQRSLHTHLSSISLLTCIISRIFSSWVVTFFLVVAGWQSNFNCSGTSAHDQHVSLLHAHFSLIQLIDHSKVDWQVESSDEVMQTLQWTALSALACMNFLCINLLVDVFVCNGSGQSNMANVAIYATTVTCIYNLGSVLAMCILILNMSIILINQLIIM